jgi:hypothetical protein
MNRRRFLAGGGALLVAASAHSARADIAQTANARVIVDNDFAGDPDGLVALAHQLASPAAKTVLVTSSALDEGLAQAGGLAPGATAALGRDLAQDLMTTMKQAGSCPTISGSETFGLDGARENAAAKAIVAEAMKADDLPLYLACGGPLTNIAHALILEPLIAKSVTLVWIGGSGEPEGGYEYNLSTDLAAAKHVFEDSQVPIRQTPQDVYKQLQESIAEINRDILPLSATTRWLYERYKHLPPFVKLGGSVGFGDSALVYLTSLAPDAAVSHQALARVINADFSYGPIVSGRRITMIDQIDPRLIVADFRALMARNA